MLSNFQFGNHALLQSYLIGQPEFREILQSPQMMQFRQRVIASCHIGPMDVEETRGYIQHRLKHAGSTGSPEFSDDSYEAIFKASSGIPRRINSLCDRLMLLGYLTDKKAFEVADVEEVAREIEEETRGSSMVQRREVNPEDGWHDPKLSETDADLSAHRTRRKQRERNGNTQDISVTSRDDLDQLLAGLNAWQFNERLARLEQSLQQLEVINSTTLTLLQKLLPTLPATDPETPAGEMP